MTDSQNTLVKIFAKIVKSINESYCSDLPEYIFGLAKDQLTVYYRMENITVYFHIRDIDQFWSYAKDRLADPDQLLYYTGYDTELGEFFIEKLAKEAYDVRDRKLYQIVIASKRFLLPYLQRNSRRQLSFHVKNYFFDQLKTNGIPDIKSNRQYLMKLEVEKIIKKLISVDCDHFFIVNNANEIKEKFDDDIYLLIISLRRFRNYPEMLKPDDWLKQINY